VSDIDKSLREYAGRWINESLLIPQIGEGVLARMAIEACDEIESLRTRLAAAKALLREACDVVNRHCELSSDECFMRVSISTDWYERAKEVRGG
jgi:hypothetical protein